MGWVFFWASGHYSLRAEAVCLEQGPWDTFGAYWLPVAKRGSSEWEPAALQRELSCLLRGTRGCGAQCRSTHTHLGRTLRESCHFRGITRKESQSGRSREGAGDIRGKRQRRRLWGKPEGKSFKKEGVVTSWGNCKEEETDPLDLLTWS